MKLKFAIFHCGKCRTSYNNPLGHVCKVRNPRGKVTAKPRLTVAEHACTACGRPMKNTFTHLCSNAGDFQKRKRKAASAAKRAKVNARVAGVRATERRRANERVAAVRAKHKAKGKSSSPRKAAERHDYRACRDRDCRRVACEAWKEALEEGFEDGLEQGYAQGYAAGVSAGASA